MYDLHRPSSSSTPFMLTAVAVARIAESSASRHCRSIRSSCSASEFFSVLSASSMVCFCMRLSVRECRRFSNSSWLLLLKLLVVSYGDRKNINETLYHFINAKHCSNMQIQWSTFLKDTNSWQQVPCMHVMVPDTIGHLSNDTIV